MPNPTAQEGYETRLTLSRIIYREDERCTYTVRNIFMCQRKRIKYTNSDEFVNIYIYIYIRESH